MELDFFKYAKGGTNKRKASEQAEQEVKKQKTSRDSEDEVEDDEDDPALVMPKHRVTAKGSRVPEHVDSFDALNDRYQVSPRLLTNLSDNGYTHPTGIQSYGIPILLEVSFLLCLDRRTKYLL